MLTDGTKAHSTDHTRSPITITVNPEETDLGTHLLPAQFDENAQAGEKPAFPLKQAVALNEEKFQPLAAELKAKLQSHQFSCFQIWRN